jgi:hypothetical protein
MDVAPSHWLHAISITKASSGEASGMFTLATWSGIYEEERNDGSLMCWPVHFLLLVVHRIFPRIVATV